MPRDLTYSSDREARLHQVLAEYLEAVEAGTAPDQQKLLARHPDLATELADFFANQARVKALAAPRTEATAATVGYDPQAKNSAAPGAVKPGSSFGEYVVIEEIARGGMGVVYKARHGKLNRVVALKRVLAEYSGPGSLRRFRMEAEAAANLDHPNIVPIYEVGEQDGQPYFTMKLIAGKGLDKEVVRFVKDPKAAARLLVTVARAVHHAHQRGILHRDLKPANILLDSQSEPHVTDFGLAKRLENSGETDGNQDMTRRGTILGTASYMAPEQAMARNDALTTAADVWALGAILYELLTGRPPFRAETFMDTLLQVVEEEPVRPRKLNSRVDPDLELICLKCLEKEPGQRFGSAAALADELEHWLAGEPISVRPSGKMERLRKWGRKNPLLALVTAALLLCLSVVVVGSPVALITIDAERRKTANANGQLEQQNVKLELTNDDLGKTNDKLNTTLGQLKSALDAKTVALRNETAAREEASNGREKLRQALVRRCVSDGSRLLEDGDPLGALVWYAEALHLDEGDADREAPHRLRLGTILARCPQTVQVWFPDKLVTDTAFSPDGKRVTGVGQDGVVRVWEVGQDKPVLKFGQGVRQSAFSKDGSRLVAVHADGKARLWDTAAGKLVQEFAHDKVTSAGFSPDDAWVVTAGEDGTARAWDLARPGKPARQTPTGPALQYAAIGVRGRVAITASDKETVWWLWQPKKDAYTPIKRGVAKLQSAAFGTADAPMLTTHAGAPNRAHVWQVNGTNVEGKGTIERRVTGELSECFNSARGLLLTTEPATASTVRSTVQAWDVNAGRLEGPRFSHPATIFHAIFSPDGKRVLTTSNDRVTRVWDAATGQPLTPYFQRQAPILMQVRFSPDGRRVLLVSGKQEVSHTLQVLEIPAVDVGFRKPAARPWGLRALVSPDGGRALSLSADQQTVHVWNTGTAKPLASQFFNTRVTQTAFSQDGGRVLAGDGTNLSIGQLNDAAAGKVAWVPVRPGGEVKQAVFSADGSRVVTLSRRGDDLLLETWDANTGRAASKPVKVTRWSAQLDVLSPDGRLLVHGRKTPSHVEIIDVATGKTVGDGALVHNSRVHAAAFSPDGRRLVMSCVDRTTHVWDTANGEAVAALPSSGVVLGVAFSSDGTLLATIHTREGGTEKEGGAAVRIWDTAIWQPITPLLPHEKVQSVAFSPDGRSLTSTATDDSVRVWELRPTDRRPAELVEQAELLASRRLHANGYLVPLDEDSLRHTWPKLRKHLATPGQ